MYKLDYLYQQWIGKSEPNGFGTGFLISTASDTSWLHEQAMKLQSQGHKIIRFQKKVGSQWQTD